MKSLAGDHTQLLRSLFLSFSKNANIESVESEKILIVIAEYEKVFGVICYVNEKLLAKRSPVTA